MTWTGWPQAGDTVVGAVSWCQQVMLPIAELGATTPSGELHPFWVGKVRADSSYGFVDASYESDPLVFTFLSSEAFDLHEAVTFDLVQKPFGLMAENLQSMLTVEHLAQILVRLHHKAGEHDTANELQTMLDELWT